jgi:hypothetical protein
VASRSPGAGGARPPGHPTAHDADKWCFSQYLSAFGPVGLARYRGGHLRTAAGSTGLGRDGSEQDNCASIDNYASIDHDPVRGAGFLSLATGSSAP